MFEIKMPSTAQWAIKLTATLVDPAKRGLLLEGNLPSLAEAAQMGISAAEIVTKATRNKDFFAPGEMVRIVTAGDEDVCEACIDLADGGPYTIEEARQQLPHHWGCRCKPRPLFDIDRPWLDQHPYRGLRKVLAKMKRGFRGGRTTTALLRRIGEPDSKQQSTALPKTVARSRRKGHSVVVVRGSRAVAVKRRRR